jgi:hypothetical protein
VALEGAPSNQLQGAARVRGGRYKESLKSFDAYIKFFEQTDRDYEPPALVCYFQAIANHHVGDSVAAQKYYFDGVKWATRFETPTSQGLWWEKVESDHLRREAASILGNENPTTAPTEAIRPVNNGGTQSSKPQVFRAIGDDE